MKQLKKLYKIPTRVKYGALLMDEVCPDWYKRVDTNILRMSSGQYCILGQTSACILGDEEAGGQYFNAINKLESKGVISREEFNGEYAANFYGFNESHGSGTVEWSELKEAWIKEINKRRKKK